MCLLKLQKGSDKTLEGASFGLYTDSACTQLVSGAVSDKDGFFAFRFTEAGTWYIKEIEAPKGYVRLISRNGNDFVVTNVASYPATGDNAELLPWAFMAMLNLCGAAMLIRKLRRKESR